MTFHRLVQVSSSSESVLKPSWVWSAMQRDFQSCLSLKIQIQIQIQSVLKLSWVLYAEELPKLSFAKNTNALRSPLPEVVDIHNDKQKCSKLSEMKDKSYICALISIKHHDHKRWLSKKCTNHLLRATKLLSPMIPVQGRGNFSQFGRSRLVYSHAHNMLVFAFSQYSNLQYFNKIAIC